MNLNLNLNLFLFYNGYKLGRMLLFIWPLNEREREKEDRERKREVGGQVMEEINTYVNNASYNRLPNTRRPATESS